MTRRTTDRELDFEDRGLDDSGVLTPRAAEPAGSWQVRSASASDAGGEPIPAPGLRDAVDGTGAPVSERGARRVFGALCVIACAEGRPGPGQRRELAEFQEFLGLSDAAARLLERQATGGGGTLRIGKRRAELEFLMGALIDVAAADGALSRVALGLIDRVNERARWSRERLHDAIQAAVERAREEAHEPADDHGEDELLASSNDSGLFEATLLPSAPVRRAARPSSSVDPLDAALDELDGGLDLGDEPPTPTRRPAPLGLEDSGEGELLVTGSPWFERR